MGDGTADLIRDQRDLIVELRDAHAASRELALVHLNYWKNSAEALIREEAAHAETKRERDEAIKWSDDLNSRTIGALESELSALREGLENLTKAVDALDFSDRETMYSVHNDEPIIMRRPKRTWENLYDMMLAARALLNVASPASQSIHDGGPETLDLIPAGVDPLQHLGDIGDAPELSDRCIHGDINPQCAGHYGTPPASTEDQGEGKS